MSRVSVIIPAYNYGRFLEECVESVRAQTYPEWEIIICDDESTDNTPDIAATLVARDPARIQYHRLKNGGVGAARNFGIQHTSGEFILPLDADDVLCPQALQEFVAALKRDPKAGYAFSNLYNLDALAGEPLHWFQGPFFKKFITSENTAACTSLWRRSLWDQGVRYRPVLIEDWDLWLQIVARGYHGMYIPEVLFQYRMHPSGRSARNKYLYLPSWFELAINNSSLYDKQTVEWAQNCMVHSPQCWNKASFVLISNDEEATTPSEYTINFCHEVSRRGHFTAVIGKYALGLTTIPGVAFLSVHDLDDIEALAGKINMCGSEVIVVNARNSNLNQRLRTLRNVSEVCAWSEVDSRNPATTIEHLLKLHEDRYPGKHLQKRDFWQSLKALEDSAKTPIAKTTPSREITIVEAPVAESSEFLYSRAQLFMSKAALAPHSWMALTPTGSRMREDWQQVAERYIDQFGQDTLFLIEGACLPPLSEEVFRRESFTELSSRAYFRHRVRKDSVFLHHSLLEKLGGLNLNLLGAGEEFEELAWRAEASGARVIWLPRGLMLSRCALETVPKAAVTHNKEVFRTVRRLLTTIGHDFRQLQPHLPVAPKLPIPDALKPRNELEKMLLNQNTDPKEYSQILVAWGTHCLTTQEEPSAREAFEIGLGINSYDVESISGLAHCALIRGEIAAAGHYAHAALYRRPGFEPALQILKFLETNGIY